MKPFSGPYDHGVLEPLGDKQTTRTIPAVTQSAGALERELEQQRRFASDASHELRTPIAGLRAELEEAQLHPDQTDLGDLLDRALSDVDRLEAIITDLRLTAGLETGAPLRPRRLDLAELVRTEVARRTDRIPVALRLEPDVTVDAVPTQIGQVLTNLLDNAQRHAERTVLIEVRRSGDSAELTVSDDGDGIAEADRKRIFQRFTRLDAARHRDHEVGRRGSGLGLAISSDIATRHAGSVEVGDSAIGGARFVLRLPLTTPSPAMRSRDRRERTRRYGRRLDRHAV
jgi:signal transduction histidine kinase